MAFEIIIKPIVFVDADEAIEYYEKKSRGLGHRFYNKMIESLNEIQSNPYNYSYVKKPVRRHRISKYPYKIFYVVSKETIL